MGLGSAEPTSIVIDGGSGDLGRRKWVPALGRLLAADLIDPRSRRVIVGRAAGIVDSELWRDDGAARPV
jgi:glucose-6-phosphate 1-dehydrogenase